jgi:uncharacterized protein with HEPN domain
MAVEMGLVRIGKAVNRIPGEVLGAFSEQPWRQIAALFTAHQYDDLDPLRVRSTVNPRRSTVAGIPRGRSHGGSITRQPVC